MGAFGGLTLTNKGKILQSKAQTGVKLNYTRIAMGDGELGSNPILALNSLIREKKSLSISKIKVLSDGKATIGATWSNSDLTEGFYFREIGVFAMDPDVGEILYCYGNSGALAEYIPPGGGTDIIERSLDITTIVGNGTNVTATIDSSLIFASQQDLAILGQTVSTQGTTLNEHLEERNPHGTTASDVGAEPAFTKNTAFNKNFGTTAGTVAQGNHNHNGVYEPVLANERKRKITFGTADPTGGVDGDIYFQYE